MNFFNEIEEKLKLPFGEIAKGFKVVYLPSATYLEGHCGILNLSNNEISFKLKKGKISFYGNSLLLSIIDTDSALIKGNIEKIEREV